MTRIPLLVVLAVFCYSYASGNSRFDDFDSTANAVPNTLQHRGFFKTVETVSLQVLVGAMGGLAGATLAKIHPVVGGVGWIVGSSFGVYSIGDEGTGRGDFWWTSAAGTAVVLVFTPTLAKSRDLGAVFALGAAMMTSLAVEIVAYHIAEGPLAPQTTLSVSFLNSSMSGPTGSSGRATFEQGLTPCLTFTISL
jgi:hypothetical protein